LREEFVQFYRIASFTKTLAAILVEGVFLCLALPDKADRRGVARLKGSEIAR
jgi:hypothetical protein